MSWKEQYGDIDPYENDTKLAPSEYDGELIEDEYGEYNPHSGSQSSTEGRCNAVLKHTEERYGEKRFCAALPQSCFGGEAKDSDYCKNHVSREKIVKQQYDSFKTGAFVQSYIHLFDKLGAAKQIVALELFESLLTESQYEFEPTLVEYDIDSSEAEFVLEDTVTVDIPVPQTKKVRGQSLWYAALSFIKVQNINEQLFADALDNGTGVSERETVVAITEDGRQITEMEEHHLNLPLSRIEKDYKEHLKLGGVDMSSDDDNDVISVDNREWTLSVMPDEEGDDTADDLNTVEDDPVPLELPSDEED